ncbi:MAG: cation-translocating P-type ATPase [Legionella sp.]|uniref:heavy metal translocating P-type ATPase n=1 Tax=Legionella sp. TaxID=459 RepID=UPI0039E5F213
MSKTYVFYVDGMTCSSCSDIIETYINKHLASQALKIEKFDADFLENSVTIVLPENHPNLKISNEAQNQEKKNRNNKDNANWLVLKALIEEAGFGCAPPPLFSHWFQGVVGCIAGVSVLTICMMFNTLPLAAAIVMASFSVPLTLALGATSYYKAWNNLVKTHSLTMESLFALSTTIILIVSLLSLFAAPWLPMMFDSALFIYGFNHIGTAIKDTIKAKISTDKFQAQAAKTVKQKIANELIDTPIENIKPSDIIMVYPEEIIPLDGICENASSIYDTISTGGTLPRYYTQSQAVLAGMRLAKETNPLEIRVSKNREDSYLSQREERIKQAALDKTPLENATKTALSYFIPAVIGISIVSAFIISIFFDPAIAIQCAASVLVSACPCTLGLIVPLAVRIGMYKAFDNGVQFQSSETLQQAEQIDTIIFDLNGTLTTGTPTVKQFTFFKDNAPFTESELLRRCAALEKKSSHPIGKAIYTYSVTNNNELEATEIDTKHHSGISGLVENRRYTMGSRTLMQHNKIPLPDVKMLPTLEAGEHLVYIACEQQIVGCMVMTDPLREDAKCTISALRAMNKEVHLCTGADEEVAKRFAQTLNIEHVKANCSPQDKTKYIQKLRLMKNSRKIAMIGDAANDIEAIATSDFSIAINSEGSDKMTLANAGAIIHTGNLLAIASAFAISKQTVTNIKQNLSLSFAYNLGAVAVASGFLLRAGVALNPAVGVALMIFQACLILLNVFRFKEQPIPHLQEAKQIPTTILDDFKSSYQRMHQCKKELQKDKTVSTTVAPSMKAVVPEKKAASNFFWSYSVDPKSETTNPNHKTECRLS